MSQVFFFIRYEKTDQYNAAFEEETQTKHYLRFRSCYFSQNNFLVRYFYFFLFLIFFCEAKFEPAILSEQPGDRSLLKTLH